MNGGAMHKSAHVEVTMGLSEEEKRDLEKMISDFQRERPAGNHDFDPKNFQKQIDTMNKRLAYLTSMFLSIDRRMQPLYETIRLTFEKSELLNQRIDAVIDTLRNGEPLK
jgi:hypothetical protein